MKRLENKIWWEYTPLDVSMGATAKIEKKNNLWPPNCTKVFKNLIMYFMRKVN